MELDNSDRALLKVALQDASMTQQRTVLIVDCCSEARQTYRQYLLAEQDFAYTIFEAASGQGGLALSQSLSLDSILLEYHLPDFNGLELIAQLQAKLNDRCPPVVMVTDLDNAAIAVQAIKSGAEDYLVKGQVTADEVRSAVRSAIANAQLRQKLQASEQQFKTSVENLLDCFAIYTSIRDESGQIVDFQAEYVNPAACEHNCMTQEQQVGKRLCDLFPAHKNSELLAEYCRVVETGEPLMKESVEYTDVFGDRCLTRADDIRVSKLNDGFVAAWRDVTVRKQTEIERERLLAQEQQAREAAERNKQQYRLLAAKLRESDRRYKAIFNSTFQLIGLLSPEGILLEVNQTALDFSGNTKEEVIDRPFWEVKCWKISPQTQARVKEAIALAAAGEFVRYEVDVLDAEDRVATVDFSLKPVFDETGRVVLLIPEARDISDKKQAEATLREVYAQLEQRAAALTQSNQNLQAVLEELQISQEEINQQNEELIRARDLSELQSQRYQDLFNFAPDGYLVTDCQGKIQEANRAAANLLASDRQELIGKPLSVFVATQDIIAFRSQLNQLGAEIDSLTSPQSVQTWELSLKPPRGKTFPAEVSLATVLNNKGHSIGWRWLIRDITQRKQAEAALQESMAILNAINTTTPTLIFVKDRQGQILMANPATIEALGKPEAEIIGKTDLDFYIDRQQALAVMENDRLVLETGQVQVFEETVELLTGTRTFLSTKSPYRDVQGNIIGLIGVSTDISDRQQVEAALRQSEALFRGVFESDLIGILFWNNEGQITDANDNFCCMTGYSRVEIQAGQINYNDITPPEFRTTDAQKFEILQTTGKYAPIEKEYICKDGSRIPILLGCAYLPGYRDRGVAFVLDISEKKQWEREREALLAREQQAREQAETANRNKDEFLAIVSHELRSPLNSILGWAKLLRTRKYDPTTANRALETIERNAQAQSQLIEDLLDISRMIRGTLRLNLAPVNLVTVVESTVTSLGLAAKAKNIALEFQLPNSAFVVSGDLYRLQQIATNLLTNAIKFTPNGGRVEVTLSQESREQGAGSRGAEEAGEAGGEYNTRPSPLATRHAPLNEQLPITNYQLPTTNYAKLQVTDTGKGISSDFLPYIFERFRQVDDPTIRSKNGLGLGLAIVRHLVELHGGTVTAASPGEGQGATFTVLLPLLQGSRKQGAGSREEPSPLTPHPSPLQGVQILVVDDDADTREFLHFALTLEGATVKVATSAREALEILERFRPDAIVSDIGMPVEDGYSLLRQVRSQAAARGEKQIPAIALTAFARESDRQQAMSAGFQAHLTKPVIPADLAAAIANLIQAAKNSKHKT